MTIDRAVPCVCGADYTKLELVSLGRFYYVRCTACHDCERGASPTHELAVTAWNTARRTVVGGGTL